MSPSGEIAVRKKLKLSEYGLFDTGTGELIVSRTEEEVYHRLGLAWIPPAMREDSGEVEAAARGEIPRPRSVEDLRGDLHTHTDLTDGVATLEDMVAAAARRGYDYYAVTDHAPNLFMQRMTDEKMLAQRDQVRRAGRAAGTAARHRAEHRPGRVGGLGRDGLDGQGLAGFDLCVASVHSHFDPAARRDDPAVRHRVREPARQHHRPPHHPADRAAPAGRRGLRRAVPGLRRGPGPRWRSTPRRSGSTCPPTTSARPGTPA